MLLVNLVTILLLTSLAKRRRKRLQEEEALLDDDDQRIANEGLRTERDVEEMQERSRTFNAEALSRTPSDLQRESTSKARNLKKQTSPSESEETELERGVADNRATVSTLIRSLSELLASPSVGS